MPIVSINTNMRPRSIVMAISLIKTVVAIVDNIDVIGYYSTFIYI